MNIIGLQIILFFFALFMLYIAFLHWKRKEVSSQSFFVWVVIWTAFLLVTIFPRILHPFLRTLFLVRVIDLIAIIAFMVLTFITYENNVRIRRYEKEIKELVKKLALQNGKVKTKKK